MKFYNIKLSFKSFCYLFKELWNTPIKKWSRKILYSKNNYSIVDMGDFSIVGKDTFIARHSEVFPFSKLSTVRYWFIHIEKLQYFTNIEDFGEFFRKENNITKDLSVSNMY